MEADQAFVEMIVKQIVDLPDKVVTERTVDERGVLITLTVDFSDMGKLIGKEGRTAKAIRTLLRVLGAKNDARVNLKIAEPEGGTGGKPRPVTEDSANDVAADDTSSSDDTSSTAVADATTDQPVQPSSADEGTGTELI